MHPLHRACICFSDWVWLSGSCILSPAGGTDQEAKKSPEIMAGTEDEAMLPVSSVCIGSELSSHAGGHPSSVPQPEEVPPPSSAAGALVIREGAADSSEWAYQNMLHPVPLIQPTMTI